jgi:DICT domain-containing protein
MTLADIIDRVESRRQTLTVLNREEVDPVMNLLRKVFDSEHVDVRESGFEPAGPANILQLQDEDGVAIATSTLDEVRDRLLMVNSDMYITGTTPLDEVETSQVVANLDDTTFTVSGKSKLLLIHISRHVERMALDTGAGVLHSGFQELSRVHDERGTQKAYRNLADTDVSVHVYGVPDYDSPPDEMHVHEAWDGEIAKSWFVVHDGDGADERKAALVCVETGPNEYEGFWTFKANVVDDVLAYLDDTYVVP